MQQMLEAGQIDVPIDAPSLAPSAPRTVDRRLVHKNYDENVLLGQVEEVARGATEIDKEGRTFCRDRFEGVICIQQHHSFFFEHHRDHVPGLYLIEAGRQMSAAVAHLFYGVPFGVEFVMTDFHAWFRNMANLQDRLTIDNTMSRHVYRKGQLSGMHSTEIVRQNGVEVAFMSGAMILKDKNLLARLEHRREARNSATPHSQGDLLLGALPAGNF
jgi:2-oxo-3-(phosphooxy)propyl 3-oxoalkanoate synthase